MAGTEHAARPPCMAGTNIQALESSLSSQPTPSAVLSPVCTSGLSRHMVMSCLSLGASESLLRRKRQCSPETPFHQGLSIGLRAAGIRDPPMGLRQSGVLSCLQATLECCVFVGNVDCFQQSCSSGSSLLSVSGHHLPPRGHTGRVEVKWSPLLSGASSLPSRPPPSRPWPMISPCISVTLKHAVASTFLILKPLHENNQPFMFHLHHKPSKKESPCLS